MILVADDAPGHLLDLPLVRVPHRRGGLGQGGVVLHRDQVGQVGEGGELSVVPELDRVVVLCKYDHLVFNDQFMHIGRATRFVVSGFPTLLILGPPLLILGPTLLILEPTWLILVVKMGIAIRKKTQTIQTVDSGFE